MLVHLFVMDIFKLVLLAIFITVVYKVALLIRIKTKKDHKTVDMSAGLVILRERFAAGEIDEKEYREKSKYLGG